MRKIAEIGNGKDNEKGNGRKRNLAVLIAAALVLSLCACGGQSGSGSKTMDAFGGADDGKNAASDKGEAGDKENPANPSDLGELPQEKGAEAGSPMEEAVEKLRPNERIYQNENGYVKVIFEDGDYYEFFDYPNELNGEYFWHCDWQVQKLEGEEREREFCTGKTAEGSRVYQKVYATHELFYPMEYYENGLSVSASYIFLDISEDTFTQINVDEYDDYCYRINYFTYSRVQKSEQ